MFQQPLPAGLRTHLLGAVSSEVQAGEYARLEALLPTERRWMQEAGVRPYAGRAALLQAIEFGEIVPVPTSPELPYRPYYQDRNRLEVVRTLDEASCSVSYLRPRALEVMGWMAAAARKRLQADPEAQNFMDEHGIAAVRYSVNSMTRTVSYQENLLSDPDKLAFDNDSTHSKGYAFDIDHSGFYAVMQDGRQQSVYAFNNPQLYFDAPIAAMHAVQHEAAELEISAFVTELPSGRGVWHVAANPLSDRALHESLATAA